jgi:hypothetical protein
MRTYGCTQAFVLFVFSPGCTSHMRNEVIRFG